MSKESRKDNCIHFLGIRDEDQVVFLKDTASGGWIAKKRYTRSVGMPAHSLQRCSSFTDLRCPQNKHRGGNIQSRIFVNHPMIRPLIHRDFQSENVRVPRIVSFFCHLQPYLEPRCFVLRGSAAFSRA